jgi:ABC-2 type transport system permease protein
MIQYSMGLKIPEEWSIWIGIFVEIVYATGFIILAKTKAIWRDS